MKINKYLQNLPDSIKVKVLRGKSGCLIAELPEYDVSTEADSVLNLERNINDLIYTVLDIPPKYYGKVWYRPQKKHVEDLTEIKIPYPFQVFFASNVCKSQFS